MADFDLIPADYHAARRWRRALSSAGLFYCISMALGAALLHATGANVDVLRRYVAEQSARAEIGQNLANELALAREALARQKALLATLAALRGGVAASRQFEVLDAAVDDRIVLNEWDFQRIDAVTDGTGALDQQAATAHLAVRGSADDNAALLAFVGRLEAQTPAARVRIVNAAGQALGEGVVFELEVRFLAMEGG